VAPRPGEGVDAVLAEAGVRHDRFKASHDRGSPGAHALVRRAWDLASLAEAYTAFVARLRPVVEAVSDGSPAEVAYAARFRLVHTWRTFLFSDPALPAELLPPRWPGEAAAAFFDEHARRLRPAADAFVDECLALTTAVPLAQPHTPSVGATP
jgi:phenylacetic acid degradation operon negative regulatory protein